MKTLQTEYWDKVSGSKEFSDPFYLEQFIAHVSKEDFIIEYGCGYGRLLNLLHQNGMKNIVGFDFSKGMIDRGKRQFPELQLNHINHAALPLDNESVSAAILSTVLCCIPDQLSQQKIIYELSRVLKPNGVLYLTDFLITDTQKMQNKYQAGSVINKEWGVYQTTEGAIVRHYTPEYIATLLESYVRCWYQEEMFFTMNHNPVKTFHGIYKKR